MVGKHTCIIAAAPCSSGCIARCAVIARCRTAHLQEALPSCICLPKAHRTQHGEHYHEASLALQGLRRMSSTLLAQLRFRYLQSNLARNWTWLADESVRYIYERQGPKHPGQLHSSSLYKKKVHVWYCMELGHSIRGNSTSWGSCTYCLPRSDIRTELCGLQ